MENWIDAMIGETATNPLSKQPEIVKEAFVVESDAAAFQDVDDQLAACKERKAQIESAIKSGVVTPGERDELIELNREINELLDYRNLKRREIYTPHLAATNLSDAEKEAAIQEYPKLADTTNDVKSALQVLFPAMAEDDYKNVRAAYWDSVFNGPMVHKADLEGMYEVGSYQLGAILDDVMACEGNKEEFLERTYGITNAELKEELLARSVVAIHDSDDMQHRDPESRFQDSHLQQSGPHTSVPGMVEMAEGEAGLNGYICFYRGKQFEVYAKTTYEAQQKCAKENGIKKSYEIRVELAEKGGEPVIHQPQDIAGSADAPDKLDYGLVMDMTKEQLAELPTLAQGQFSNLKFDDGKHRVWLSRMTKEDGAQEDHAIEFEVLQNGVWRQAAYGDKRDHKKIEIFVDKNYKSTTTWASTCAEAKAKYLEANPELKSEQVTCKFASIKTADFWIRDPKDPKNLIRVAPVDEPAAKAEPVFEAYTEPPKETKGPATKSAPVDNAFSNSDFGYGEPEPVQESPVPANKPAAPAPVQQAPEAPGKPETPKQEAPAEQDPKLKEFASNLVDWKEMNDAIVSECEKFREALMEKLADKYETLKQTTKQQYPELKEMLRVEDEMETKIGGWRVFLQTISQGKPSLQKAKVYDLIEKYGEDYAKEINTTQRMIKEGIYNLIAELKSRPELSSQTPASEDVGVIPEKDNKPSRVRKLVTSLDWPGLSAEAGPITQKMKEYSSMFLNFVKRTLLPLLKGTMKRVDKADVFFKDLAGYND